MDFRDSSMSRLVADLRAGRGSAEGLLASTMARIAQWQPQLNAFSVLRDGEAVLAEARCIDERLARGEDPGPLAGMPLAVKDIEDVAGLPTSFGSALFDDAPPATADSIEVARLRAAGAIVVGKTNTPEFGCKGATDNALFGATCNPWNLAYSPGGSSGGSSAALAAGLVPLATGSDGGGSIRIPAALCGHSGFKPSQGRVPMGGAPTTGPLAVRGPMTLRLADTVRVLDVLRGDHPADIFGLPDAGDAWTPVFEGRRLPEKVLWCPTLGYAEIDAEVAEVCEAAVEGLRVAGVQVIEVESVFAEHPLGHWWTLWTTLLARKLGGRRDDPRWERVDPALKAMVATGLKVSGVDFALAMDACHHYNDQLEQAFAAAPYLLSPTCAGRTPKTGEGGTINGRPTAAWVEMTFGFNMTRNPAASVHAGVDSEGLPVGLQIVGRQRDDLGVLCAAGAIEDLLGGPGRALI